LIAPPSKRRRRRPGRRRWRRRPGFVLTRLHARYDKNSVKNDLVFKEAPAIVGGRERRGADGKLENGSSKASRNNFQARYAIRHEWTGPIECKNPVRGRWGGPPSQGGGPKLEPALNLAFAPRGKLKLARMVRQSVPEVGVTAVGSWKPTPKTAVAAEKSRRKAKKGCSVGGDGPGLGMLLIAGALVVVRRRRR
jgi:MYXO-CTERM domain-containing protein